LKDTDESVRLQAALALADNKDASGRKELEQGLKNDRMAEQCALALWTLGLRGQPKSAESPDSWTRSLVVTVKTQDADNSFVMKVPLNFFKAVEKSLPTEVVEEMTRKGLTDITKLAATAPKGQVLFLYKDKNTRVTIIVDE
jgi:hypothetical protein